MALYRVGYQCVSEQQANDLILSQMPPFYLRDGSLSRPELVGGQWQYMGRVVTLDFPECSPSDQVYQGAYFGVLLVLAVAVSFGFKQIYRLIYSIGGNDDN